MADTPLVQTMTLPDLKYIDVTSGHGFAGKRGFRVYPQWSTNLNAQARRTQLAQAAGFSRLG